MLVLTQGTCVCAWKESERSGRGSLREALRGRVLCLRVLRRISEHDRLHTAQPIDKIRRLVRGRGRGRGKVSN